MEEQAEWKIFQKNVLLLMEKRFQMSFENEGVIHIGNPPKSHKFDCVSDNKDIVVECKCYSWTKKGNSPSAKISTLNEAVLYMKFLNSRVKKILAIKKKSYNDKKETLAEYYCRINGHLLDDIEVDEIDDNGYIRIIRSGR